mmetsp:Transcript_19202/g.27933  ORF Transcript_19202/g.27933 Transcript_19202/m.27933 type:complete len:360 (-) Transcript_19202:375-1454(-)
MSSRVMIHLLQNNKTMTTRILTRQIQTTTTKRPPSSSYQQQNRHFSNFSFIDESSTKKQKTASNKTALILGSSGILGKTIVQHLSHDLQMTIIGADVIDPVKKKDIDALDAFIPLQHTSNATELTKSLSLGMRNINDGKEKVVMVDAIICASGGWEGDPTSSYLPGRLLEEDGITPEMAAEEWGKVLDKMLQMNLHPVLAAGNVASTHMANQGLFVAFGATAALMPTPGMAAYGAAKAATHQYIQTLGAMTGLGIGHNKIRKDAKKFRRGKPYLDDMTAVAILPTMLDTPTNRKFATRKDDFNAWTKPIDIAEEIGKWVVEPYLRPSSGSLIKVYPPRFQPGDDDSDGEWSKSTFGQVR